MWLWEDKGVEKQGTGEEKAAMRSAALENGWSVSSLRLSVSTVARGIAK